MVMGVHPVVMRPLPYSPVQLTGISAQLLLRGPTTVSGAIETDQARLRQLYTDRVGQLLCERTVGLGDGAAAPALRLSARGDLRAGGRCLRRGACHEGRASG